MTDWLHSWLQQVVAFAGESPTTVGAILCFAAAAEAIILVGALVPGEAMVLAVAAAAGAAGLDLLPMILWTSLGAIAGDGISFWIGHRNGEAIAEWSYLKKRPYLLANSENFISRHGTKSILIARFLPALRAIVPVAAGVLKMPPLKFYLANILSAVIWSVLHIVPAAGLGLAFTTLGAVSGRLTIFVALALVGLFLAFWLLRVLLNRVAPPLSMLYARLIAILGGLPWSWSKRLADWLDPEHPKLAGMAVWSVWLLLAVTGFFAVLEDIVTGEPLVRADVAIGQLMQNLRTEPVDAVMVMITSLGDAAPLTAAALALLVLLLVQRAYRTAAAAALVIATATAFVPLIKLILHKPRPIDIYSGVDAYGFPSGHTTISAVLFGVFAVLIARSHPLALRLAIYVLASLWVAAVGLSRIYLSAHWPSDVLGGLFFGAALTSIFALLVVHIDTKSYSRGVLAAGFLAVFLGVGFYHAFARFDTNSARYAPRVFIERMTLADWTKQGWQNFPRTRFDLGGELEEDFLLQWAGTPEQMSDWLQSNGWRQSASFTWRDALAFLMPRSTFKDLAPLPLLHNGTPAAATFLMDPPTAADSLPAAYRLVLRLWRSNTIVSRERAGAPVLLGTLAREVIAHPFGLVSVPRQRKATAGDQEMLLSAIQKNGKIRQEETPPGSPLLLWPTTAVR